MVVINLLQNACRHTKNGVITILAELLECSVQIGIKDTGEGMTPDVAAHLFEQYLNNSAKASGTGLGLYLCKKTIEAYDGKIWITTRQNVGTEVFLYFLFQLPEMF